MCSTWRSPVVQATRIRQAMRQSMGYAKAAAALQLRQHNNDLSAEKKKKQ